MREAAARVGRRRRLAWRRRRRRWRWRVGGGGGGEEVVARGMAVWRRWWRGGRCGRRRARRRRGWRRWRRWWRTWRSTGRRRRGWRVGQRRRIRWVIAYAIAQTMVSVLWSVVTKVPILAIGVADARAKAPAVADAIRGQGTVGLRDVAVALATPLEHRGVRVRVGHVHRSLETFLCGLEGHAGLVRARNRVVAKETVVAHAVRHVSPCGAQNHPAVGGDAGGGGADGGMKFSQKHSRAKLGTAN